MKPIYKYFLLSVMLLAMGTAITSCNDDDNTVDPYDINYVYMYSPAQTDFLIKYLEDGTLLTHIDDVAILVPVKSTKPAPKEVKVTVEIDNSLIETYNKDNGTDYKALESAELVSNTLTIPQGKYVSSDTIKLSYTNKEDFSSSEPQKFIIPIIVKEAKEATLSEKHLFYMTYQTKKVTIGVENQPIGTRVADRSVWLVTANGTDVTSKQTDGSSYTYSYLLNNSQVVVNLGTKTNINTVSPTFYSASYAPNNIKIEVSEDGQDYIEIGTIDSSNIKTPNIVLYKPASAQYIRLTTSGSNSYMTELNVFTTE